MGRLFMELLEGQDEVYTCKKCGNYLTNKDNLESPNFQGATGKATLFRNVVNVDYGINVEKSMTTGKHFVRDIFCKGCQEKIGWMYEMALPKDQVYKEGQYIIENAFFLRSSSYGAKTFSMTSPEPTHNPYVFRNYDRHHYDNTFIPAVIANRNSSNLTALILGNEGEDGQSVQLNWNSRGYRYRDAARLRRAQNPA